MISKEDIIRLAVEDREILNRHPDDFMVDTLAHDMGMETETLEMLLLKLMGLCFGGGPELLTDMSEDEVAGRICQAVLVAMRYGWIIGKQYGQINHDL